VSRSAGRLRVLTRRPLIGFGPPEVRGVRPATIAIPPIDHPPGDSAAARLGLRITALLVDRLGALPNVKVLTRPATNASQRPTHVVEAVLVRASPDAELVVRVYRSSGAAMIWENTLRGRPSDVEAALLSGMHVVLSREHVWSGRSR